MTKNMASGNTKGGSIIVPLTSCLNVLDWFVLQIKTNIFSCHTTYSKPVKQEVNGIVIILPLVFPDVTWWQANSTGVPPNQKVNRAEEEAYLSANYDFISVCCRMEQCISIYRVNKLIDGSSKKVDKRSF